MSHGVERGSGGASTVATKASLQRVLWLNSLSCADWRWLLLGSGALSAAAFAPLNLWPLMVGALALLLLGLARAQSAGEAWARSFWFAWGQGLAGLYWIAVSFQFQAQMPATYGLLAVAFLAAFLALYGSFAGLAAWAVAGRPRQSLAALGLALTGFWTLGEQARGLLFTGFAWNGVGQAWLGFPPLAQAAALIGALGLSLLMLLAGVALALWITGVRRWAGILAGGLAVVALAGGGRLLLGEGALVPDVQLHLVQANIGQAEKWGAQDRRRHLREHLALTQQALATRAVVSRREVVIWPETATPFNFIEDEPSTRYLMARHLPPSGLILAGGLRLVRDGTGTPVAARNSLFVLDAHGQTVATYDKANLVPFGEFLPWRGLLTRLGLARLAPGALDILPGPGPVSLAVAGVPTFRPLICYEAIFAEAGTGGVRPRWLLNISNDSWFGVTSGSYQHLAQARLRAIEQGVPLVRSTSDGISAVVDPYGRLIARLGLQQRGVLTSGLPQALGPTLFSVWGANGALLAAGLCVLLGGIWRKGSGSVLDN